MKRFALLSFLIIAAVCSPGVLVAGVVHGFEEYADDAQWTAAGRGGWVLSGAPEFRLSDNPRADSVNPSARCIHIISAVNTSSGLLRLDFAPMTSGKFSFNVYSPNGGISGPPYNHSGWVMGGVNPSLFHGMFYEYLDLCTVQYGNTEPYGGYTSSNMASLGGGWHTINGVWNASGRLSVWQDGVKYADNVPMRDALGSGVSYFLFTSADFGDGRNGSDVYVDNIVIDQVGTQTYQVGDIELVIDELGTNIVSLKFSGVGAHFIGDANSSMWKIYFADAACLAANDKPLIPPDQTVYYSTPWELGNSFITSRDAQLTGKVWDEANKKLTLTYTHAKADVTITISFGTDIVDIDASVINKCTDPLQLVQAPAGWQLVYGQTEENTFIMPLNNSGIEYRSVKNFAYWMSSSAWDGFIVTSPSKQLGLFNVQVDGQGSLLSTETSLLGNGGYPGQVGVTNGTICWRNNGASVDKVKVRIGRWNNLRAYADAYNQANFPNQRKLTAKTPADKLDKIAGAILLSTEGHYNAVANIVDDLPGTVIIHPPQYMHPTIYSSAVWDAFPNYFYPNRQFASVNNPYIAQSELENMIAKTNLHGHLFMPRTSFFYWAEGSDADMEFLGDTMAMVRVDGKVQKAYWSLPGWIISPSSQNALNLMYGYYNTWKSIGSSLYFTNVIGAIAPLGHRYDFHPDAPAPDLFFNQIYKLMDWHGSRMPLFSEVGCSRQMPYQAGFCMEPSWDFANPGPAHWRDPFRGEYLRYREEMQSYIGHDYVNLSPPNNGGPYPDTWQRITFSFLHGFRLKWAMDADVMGSFNWRWMRTLATLGQKVSKPLYGKKLVQFDRDVIPGVHRADYEGSVVTGNFSVSDFQLDEHTIPANGFLFLSADGKILAGYLSKLNGRQLERSELVIIDSSDPPKTKVYTPNAQQTVTVYIKTDPSRVASVTAYHSAVNSTNVTYTSDAGGISFTVPVFTAGQGSFIPYVEVASTPAKISASKAITDGNPVLCSGIISATFDGYFYIQSADRSSGIRVSKPGYTAAVGTLATVSGLIDTLPSEERQIVADTISSVPDQAAKPLGVNNKSLGGAGTVGQSGVADGVGPNNIGLLVRTTGRVTEKGSGWFKINDGSGTSVKVCGDVPAANPYVVITGISSCEKDTGSDIQRVILATDVREISP